MTISRIIVSLACFPDFEQLLTSSFRHGAQYVHAFTLRLDRKNDPPFSFDRVGKTYFQFGRVRERTRISEQQ